MSQNWVDTNLGEIAVVDWGNTNLTKKAFVEDGPYLGVSAAGCDGRMDHAEHKKFTPVLSAIGAQCGRMFLPDEDFTAIKNTITLTPKSDQTDRHFLYYLMTFVELPQRGAGQPFISKGDIQKFPVSVPPLEEQKRIVAVLDQAFAALDRARANAEANLADAEELFESQLDAVFGTNTAGWISDKLASLCSKIGSGATPKGGAASYKSEGISLIRSLNVYDRDFREEKLAFIDDDQAAKLANVKVEADDVLFNITGASVARCCIAPKQHLPARVNQHVSILRPNRTRLQPEFLCYLLTARTMKDRLLKVGSEGGATRQAITKAQLEALEVAFPEELGQQTTIVADLKAQSEKCAAVSNAYKQAIEDINELRQSILQKAFAGELT